MTRSLRLVVTGHVDHGKSTIVGRLLADTGSLPQGKLERVQAYCRRHAKPFEYAFLLDALKDEQSQGITIEASRIFFKTAKREYALVDAPGHVEFIRNMISGASEASAALLVIDAKEGVRENSRRHGYLLSLLGVRQAAVLVNKMDLVDFRESAFKALTAEYGRFLRKIGAAPSCFIPVSGFHGDNLASRSARMTWYRGPTVLEALDAFEEPAPRSALPFRMPVQGVYKFSESEDARRVVAGTVEAGKLSAGDEVVFYPSGKSSVVSAIEEFPPVSRKTISAGMASGFSLTQQLYVKRGEVAAKRGERPPRVATRVQARLVWLGREPLRPGKDYLLKLGTARAAVRLEKVVRALDVSSLAARAKAASVDRHEVAECVLRAAAAFPFDLASDDFAGGRFVLVDDRQICGGGLIEKALPDDSAWLREKVFARNLKWQTGLVPAEKRARRFKQKPALVLVTGPRVSKRKEVAKALEKSLFEAGRAVYYLGLGSALYGVSADIRGENVGGMSKTVAAQREVMRRLAEIAHILLDAGLIVIVSAADLGEDDLAVIRAAVDPDRVEVFRIGKSDKGAVAAIEARLRVRGFLEP